MLLFSLAKCRNGTSALAFCKVSGGVFLSGTSVNAALLEIIRALMPMYAIKPQEMLTDAGLPQYLQVKTFVHNRWVSV